MIYNSGKERRSNLGLIRTGILMYTNRLMCYAEHELVQLHNWTIVLQISRSHIKEQNCSSTYFNFVIIQPLRPKNLNFYVYCLSKKPTHFLTIRMCMPLIHVFQVNYGMWNNYVHKMEGNWGDTNLKDPRGGRKGDIIFTSCGYLNKFINHDKWTLYIIICMVCDLCREELSLQSW